MEHNKQQRCCTNQGEPWSLLSELDSVLAFKLFPESFSIYAGFKFHQLDSLDQIISCHESSLAIVPWRYRLRFLHVVGSISVTPEPPSVTLRVPPPPQARGRRRFALSYVFGGLPDETDFDSFGITLIT